jgi:hypothetical protein
MSFSKRLVAIADDPAKKAAIDQLKGHIFLYSQLKEVLSCMEECMVMSRGAIEPRCMTITGGTGVGKTVAIQLFMQQNPRRDVNNITLVPVLNASIPKPATIIGVVTSMLRSLGAPGPERGTYSTKLAKLYALLETCQVQLIILDEFQHLFEHGTARRLDDVSDWIKTLINHTNIPVVLCGMPSAEDVLACNPQLRRRFRVRRELRPFSWKRDRLAFLDMLTKVESVLPFRHASDLAGAKLAPRLWLASTGNMANLMYLIEEVGCDAILRGAPLIGMDAFADFLRAELGDVVNPFSMSDSAVEALLEQEAI